MDYYGVMLHFFRLRHLTCSLALATSAVACWAQSDTPATAPQDFEPHSTIHAQAAPLSAELFYEIFLGELTARAGDYGTGYTLILEAARRSADIELYRRAIEIALQARSGESALVAARAWKNAYPDSREATRSLLQILVALNRITETAQLLREALAQTPEPQHIIALQSIVQLYARASDKAQAVQVVQGALQDELNHPALAPTVWVTLGRMHLAAHDKKSALAATERALTLDPAHAGAALLAMELGEAGMAQAQPLVAAYFAGNTAPELRMVYARTLLNQQRYPEAQVQLEQLTQDNPDLEQAWLLLATLHVQYNRIDLAQSALQRYDDLVQHKPSDHPPKGGLTQSYLLQAQIAEKLQDYDAAHDWLQRIDHAPDLFGAQVRRASLLARQGRLSHARALIRSLPADTPEDERMKASAEVQLLREVHDYAPAYALQKKIMARWPEDNDLAYDTAMLAEKIGDIATMERVLRQIIARQPDYHHALNALGYSWADRGKNLSQAQTLIEQALRHAPGDPYIMDSLAWVQFRQGKRTQAAQLLRQAFDKHPDAEIAAHLGEVLWSLEQREAALQVWRTGLRLNATNEVLKKTLKRLGVQP